MSWKRLLVAIFAAWKCFEHSHTGVTNPLQANLMWFCSKRLLCQTYFFIKSCLSHTFPRAVQSVTQTERVHLSLPIYALLFSPRLSPSCNAGMVDSCLLIQCHGLFPLSVCFDVSIQRDQWVSQRASVSRPTPDIRTQTPQSSWSFFRRVRPIWSSTSPQLTRLPVWVYHQGDQITPNVDVQLGSSSNSAQRI